MNWSVLTGLLVALTPLAAAAQSGADAGPDAPVSPPVPPQPPQPSAEPVPAPVPEPSPANELELFQLDSQLNQAVAVATHTEQRAAQTPSIVTVITGEEIRQRGYTSLADALRWVPGFYDVYDLVTHNIGVRGINGGADASGDVVKLMIDGMAVDFRPTTGNFFGEELIPLEVIDRVEIIRGPASALYGANAFLGAINIITRKGGDISGARVTGQGALVRGNAGGGGGLTLGGAGDDIDVIFGASASFTDRSGLPPSAGSIAAIPRLATAGASQGDVSRPKSLFGKVTASHVAGGTVTATASIQDLDAFGEWQDFYPLSHDTRIALLNQDYRLRYEVEPVEKVDITASLTYFDSAPLPYESLDVGSPQSVEIPQVATDGWGVTLEGRVSLVPHLGLIAGGDFSYENNLLQTFNQRFRHGTEILPAGTTELGPEAGARKLFTNLGVYAQAAYALGEDWSFTVGGRIDDQNIYGVNPTARVGIVFAPPNKPFSVKLLYGSSFKAPSADQLYTQQLTTLTPVGNPNLQAQYAHTGELGVGYILPRGWGELSVNGYVTDVLNRVEFIQEIESLYAENLPSALIVGGEMDGRFNLAKWAHLRVLASLSDTVSENMGSYLQGEPIADEPLFPEAQLHLIVDLQLPWQLFFSPEVSFIGPRSASQPNVLIHGSAYSLEGYVYTAATLATHGWMPWAGHETRIALRMTDITGQIWYDPGFNGLDVPSVGRTLWLTVTQAL